MRKEKKYHFIYKTTNLLSGRYYIGMHSSDSLTDGYLGSGKRLRYSINKYGKEHHVREILEFCKTREELKSREEEVVNLNEIAKIDCMNMVVGGQGMVSGFRHTIETREKMSIAKQNMTDETKEKIRKGLIGNTNGLGNIGKIVSDTAKKKMSISKKANKNPFFGKTHTSDNRKKISEYQSNKSVSAETRQRMSISSMGHAVDDATRQKISQAHIGKKQKIIKCPYCEKTGGISTMKQRHIKNCKLK